MSSREALGKVFFWVAAANLLPAVVLGSSKSGDPLVPDAQHLFVSGGVVLVLYGIAVLSGYAFWIGMAADRPRLAGTTLVALGLASIGVGLFAVLDGGPWRVLTLPAIVLVAVGTVHVLRQGRRNWFLRRLEQDSVFPRRLVVPLFAFAMLLACPILALWAVGVIEFD